MARGTSPGPRGSPSNAWAAVASMVFERASAGWRRLSALRRRPFKQFAATLYLAGLASLLLSAWQAPIAGSSGTAFAVGGLHLLGLLGLGTMIAVTSLASSERPLPCAVPDAEPSDGLRQLMAHMHHALRTPLNAVIGFSEVMACELHGPLGHSRYQEYAHHICESGERLLKSSEDALAVTQAMTALMTDRTRGRPEQVAAGALLRQAWTAIGDAAPVVPTGCDALVISCERRATAQALEHLIRHALTLAGPDAVEVTAWPKGSPCLQVRVWAAAGRKGSDCGDLHIIFARLLLEAQGATLVCSRGETSWSASVGFGPGG
jgi:signal transduction histidine kinase